jgi:hypothetical protein
VALGLQTTGKTTLFRLLPKEYHLIMSRLSSAPDRSFARLAVVLLLLALPLSGQVRGVPASVTSYGFGGHFNPNPGPPASVTSLGPNGFHSGNSGRSFCCGTVSRGFHHPPGFGDHHRRGGAFFGGIGSVYAVPYPVYVMPDTEPPAPSDQFPEEEYRGGPTIFDRRGPGPSRANEAANAAPERNLEPAHEPSREPDPAADQPQTLLVFKDGRQFEVQNYAIVGNTLLDMTEGHHRRVPLSDLDVEATAKQNDDRGIDFRLPPQSQSN